MQSADSQPDGTPDTEALRELWSLASLSAELARLASEALTTDDPQFLRIEIPTDVVDPLLWLAANPSLSQVFWSGRGADAAVAGLGVADRIAADGVVELQFLKERLDNRLRAVPESTRYYGGLRFDLQQQPSPEWAGFGSFNFVIPRVEIVVSGGDALVAINLAPSDWRKPERVLDELASISFECADPGGLSVPVYRDNFPDESGWRKNIDWSLDAFSTSRLAKVVLARRATLGFEEPVSAVALMRELSRATSSSYHFMFAPDASGIFVGASPERLFRLDGRRIWSEAVAGTRRRGDTEGADAELCKELLLSEKDQREHVYVRQSIKETLSGLCSQLHVDASASEMLLTRGRHLVSRVEGVADGGVRAVDFLIGLHPTPAVGGYPTSDAIRAIANLEGFDRGWYAAPVGWIGPDAAEFAVAIRSGLVEGKQVSLYSGAGIVGGSTAEGEWAEIEDKLADFVSVFGADGSTAK